VLMVKSSLIVISSAATSVLDLRLLDLYSILNELQCV